MYEENDIANVPKYANELPNLQRYCQSLQNQVQDLIPKSKVRKGVAG